VCTKGQINRTHIFQTLHTLDLQQPRDVGREPYLFVRESRLLTIELSPDVPSLVPEELVHDDGCWIVTREVLL